MAKDKDAKDTDGKDKDGTLNGDFAARIVDELMLGLRPR
jgi:hypothetical protein